MVRRTPLLLLLCLAAPASAVPVVPNFTQGTMTQTTETTSTVTETINSMDYSTGWTYSVSGTNVQHDGTSMTPDTGTAQSNTLNGVTSSWTGLDVGNKPNWTITSAGDPFQFTEHYVAPGLQTHTIINRTQTIQSVTTSTSIFSQ
ncbi:MAG: hypothetical protein CML93_03395 [Rhodobiaceae bacterium]|nr:hypothetical protein [Rhodobiaceae bacterium]